jgi:outer membrane protein assembly factor BamA
MRRPPFVAVYAGILIASICAGQSGDKSPTVLVREVHFTGEPGGTERQLGESTEFLVGHRMEQKAAVQEASSSVTAFLRHRGYLKSRVTPEVRSTRLFGNSKEQAVALEIAIEPGNRYRVRGVTFAGLSREAPDSDLRQACILNDGDVADGEEVGNCVANLRALFQKKGLEVAVTPNMTFDDEHLAVAIKFDIEK